MKKPLITSVTLNWKGKDVLLRCIQSLKEQTMPLYEIIVVDNASGDGSIDEVRAAYPDVVIVENGANWGAPKGRNSGLRRALEKPIDFIFTLDNDLFAAPDCVEKLIAGFGDSEKIATVGAFIYADNDENKLLSAGAVIDYTQNVSRQLKVSGDLDQLNRLSYCGTGHMMTRASLYREIGLLDERYIGYGFEDTDFGMRTKKAGYEIVSYGRARVWHKAHSNIGYYSFKKKYLESRNAMVFMKRYGHLGTWSKYLFFAVGGLLAALVIQAPKGNIAGVYGKALGLFDGLMGNTKRANALLVSSK